MRKYPSPSLQVYLHDRTLLKSQSAFGAQWLISTPPPHKKSSVHSFDRFMTQFHDGLSGSIRDLISIRGTV